MPLPHRILASVSVIALVSPFTTADDGPVPRFKAVEFTQKLKDDKTEKLWLDYHDKVIEVEGEVLVANLSAQGGGQYLELKGCQFGPDLLSRMITSFGPEHPDYARAKLLDEGDVVTLRGTFSGLGRAMYPLKDPQLVAGPDPKSVAIARADRKPVRTTTAEAFVREALADPAAAEAKFKGKVLELTGTVSTNNPQYSYYGLSLSAGKLKPTDLGDVFADCKVPEDQREKVWLLAKSQKVKVVGALSRVEPGKIRLVRCEVTELEPNPIPTASAADLAAAYVENPKGIDRKYGWTYDTKELFLTGVVKATSESQDNILINCDVTGPIGVRVVVAKSQGTGLKAGDRLRLKADCRGAGPFQGVLTVWGHIIKD